MLFSATLNASVEDLAALALVGPFPLVGPFLGVFFGASFRLYNGLGVLGFGS